jgi:hypothetical protein
MTELTLECNGGGLILLIGTRLLILRLVEQNEETSFFARTVPRTIVDRCFAVRKVKGG